MFFADRVNYAHSAWRKQKDVQKTETGRTSGKRRIAALQQMRKETQTRTGLCIYERNRILHTVLAGRTGLEIS